MKKQLGVFNNWYNPYLDVIDSLYGFQEAPLMSITEVSDEWLRAFGSMNANGPETNPFLGGSDAYLMDLEELHGDWDLHPSLSLRERCEEWQRCFGANSVSLQVRTKPTVAEDAGAWELISAS